MTGPPTDETLAALARSGEHPRDAVPRVVVASDYLVRLLPEGGRPATLTAAEWEEALLYAGLLPLVREGGGEAAPALAGRLGALKEALEALHQAEGGARARAALVPRGVLVPDAALAGLAGISGLGLVAGSDLVAGGALALLLVGLAARTLLAKGAGRSAERPDLQRARATMTRAVSAFLRHTWVEPVGDGLLESAPAAAHLRDRMAALDQTLRRARARLAELERIAVEIRSANRSLGQPEDDAETSRVDRQRQALATQIDAAAALRERFVEQLAACEASLERLRALARRKLLSHRLSAAMERDDEGRDLAEVEVDVADLDERADTLGREVADAELRLSATLEVAAAVR